MADLLCGPNSPMAVAFAFCGWRTFSVDLKINPEDDVAQPGTQSRLHEQLQEAALIAVAYDCSTKSRIREIPRVFSDGRPAPQPLRTEEEPLGRWDLDEIDAARVAWDNAACDFLMDEVSLCHDRGGGTLQENPWRSLHWALPRQQQMIQSGEYWDLDYHACALQGARCKRQNIRHDIEELTQWEPMPCGHVHDPDEWKPYEVEGTGIRVYPSHEEAEYTAALAFSLAVSCSYWAVRKGFARLKLGRLPAVVTSGDRRPWLNLPPQATREWAMIPMALALGVGPDLHADAEPMAAIRGRRCVDDVILVKGQGKLKQCSLPEGCIYIGRGHHTHRLSNTAWSSPYIPGLHGSPEECMSFYTFHLRQSGLVNRLHELRGKMLVCDCSQDEPCHGDVLLAEEWLNRQPRRIQAYGGRGRGRGNLMSTSHLQGVVLAAMLAQGWAMPAAMPLYFSQETVVRTFCKLLPEEVAASMPKFPMIEDLINAPPFSCYAEWRHEMELEMTGPWGPVDTSGKLRFGVRVADGVQQGALSHKAALPQLVSYGLPPDEHFQASLEVASQPLPTEQEPMLDDDLHFAAHVTSKHRGRMRGLRKSYLGCILELSRRLECVSNYLKRKMHSQVASVLTKRHVAFIMVGTIIILWPDFSYGADLMEGLPGVGHSRPCGAFPAQQYRIVTEEEILQSAAGHNARMEAKTRPGEHDVFLRETGQADAAAGFASQPMSKSELEEFVQGQPYRLIRRKVIVQPNGKKRAIDDADEGGQSELSSDGNKLLLCSAVRPVQHCRLISSKLELEGVQVATMQDTLESGGEDWPSAYRYTPMKPAHSMFCVVVYWDCERQELVYQVYYGQLFGLPLAVTSFNRWPKLCEALARRWLVVVVSHYFDDANVVDLASSKGSAQDSLNALMRELGTPYQEEKRQKMSSRGDFLGLEHDLSKALSHGWVSLWVRERLQSKLEGIISQAEGQACLGAGVASKLYGSAVFFEQGTYGKIGRAGLNAIKQRQQEHGQLELTADILRSFGILKAIMQAKPYRVAVIRDVTPERTLVASDAAFEEDVGTGGLLIVSNPGQLQEQRQAAEAVISDEVMALWTSDVVIAQLELLMVLVGLVVYPECFRGRQTLWMLDNTAALMAMVRGRSDSEDLDQLAVIIHAMMYGLQAAIYFEWVESKSNWSDGISREGRQDRWYVANRFSFQQCAVPVELWRLPLRALLRLGYYL